MERRKAARSTRLSPLQADENVWKNELSGINTSIETASMRNSTRGESTAAREETAALDLTSVAFKTNEPNALPIEFKVGERTKVTTQSTLHRPDTMTHGKTPPADSFKNVLKKPRVEKLPLRLQAQTKRNGQSQTVKHGTQIRPILLDDLLVEPETVTSSSPYVKYFRGKAPFDSKKSHFANRAKKPTNKLDMFSTPEPDYEYESSRTPSP